MQPTKAITIVIVALILTGMCGYLLQPEHEEVSVTKYDYKGDLTPSVIYSQIDDWTEYNPLTNVTGWRIQEGTDIPTTDNANQYVLDPAIIEYNSVSVTNPASSKILSFTASFGTSYKGVYLFEYLTKLPDNNVLHCDDGFRWHITTTNYSPVSVVALNSDWKYELGGQSHIVTDITYDKFDEKWYPVVLDDDSGVYERVGDGRKANYITSTDTSQTNYGMFVRSVNDTTVRTLTQYVPVLSDATYVDSTKFVQISSGTEYWSNSQVNGIIDVLCTPNTVFVLGESSSVSFPDDFPYDYGLVTLNFNDKVFTCKGVSAFSNTLAYSVVDYDYAMKVSAPIVMSGHDIHPMMKLNGIGTMIWGKYVYNLRPGETVLGFNAISEMGSKTYDYYQLNMRTVLFSNDSATPYYLNLPSPIEIEPGVESDRLEIAPYSEVEFHFGKWEIDGEILTDYTVGVEWTDGKGVLQNADLIVHIVEESELATYPMYKDYSEDLAPVTGLNIRSGNTDPAKVYISGTVVAVDPSGLLWGNPELPLKYYYPAQMNEDTRVLFNGFVKYGNTITVNSHTFPVDNGRLVYTHTETVYPEDYPRISVRALGHTDDLPAGHEIFEITYLGGYYDYPIIVDTEVTFAAGVATATVNLPIGAFTMNIVKSVTGYTIVGQDEPGYEYDGVITTSLSSYTDLVKRPGTVTLTDYLPLKGMAVDFIKDPVTNLVKVSLVFTEYRGFTLDLGNLDTSTQTLTYTVTVYDPESGTTSEETKTINTVAGYVIAADGTWFWQSGIYSVITTVDDQVLLDWTSGQFGLTMTGCCFLMILFMILGTAVLYRFTDMEFTALDWIILAGVVFLLLGVAIM